MSLKSKIYRFSLVLLLSWAWLLGQSQAALAQESGARYENRGQVSQVDTRQISAKIEEATVLIIVEGPGYDVVTGTGFVVAPGYVVTNAHLFSKMVRGGDIIITNEKLAPIEAQLVDYLMDKTINQGFGGRDLALLKFQVPFGRVIPALTFNLESQKMDKVGAWGYPGVILNLDMSLRDRDEEFRSSPIVYTEGTISTYLSSELCKSVVHTADVAGGNSGGPLVNTNGEVVGINTWIINNDDQAKYLNVAQDASEVVAFLQKNKIKPLLAQGQVYVAKKDSKIAPSRSLPPKVSLPKNDEPPIKKRGRSPQYRELDGFFVQVPEGWAVKDEESDSITLSTVEPGSAVFLSLTSNEGFPTDMIAEFYAALLDGATTPRLDQENGDTYVTYGKLNDEDAILVVSGDEFAEKVAVIVLVGDLEAPGIETILDSIVEK
ncbi:MAG: serine protease [Deltaproteobacteria bacterium]|nr:serine protease [Deltaproteobacteria bacterium]